MFSVLHGVTYFDCTPVLFPRFGVIVKLTSDTPGTVSQVRMAGEDNVIFSLGVAAGSCALFDARCQHASVALTPNTPDVVKLVYFFSLPKPQRRRQYYR